MGFMDKMKAAAQSATNAVAPQAQPAYGPPQGYGAPVPAPQAARPALEYDEDGELEHVWDTNALQHGPWSVQEFETALQQQIQRDRPDLAYESAEVVAEMTAMYRAELYKYWKEDGGWEVRSNAQTVLQAAADPSSHPMLAPVHGVTLSDYAQIVLKQTEGVDPAVAVQAMGLDPVVWDDARATWERRMAEDTTFTVVTEYGKLFNAGVTDPRLLAIGGSIVTTNQANLDRLKADRAFTLEISAARSSAYNAGLDGNKWMMDTIGVSPTDFQQVENQWAQHMADLATRSAAGDQAAYQAINDNAETELQYARFYESKLEEYAKQFAAQAGGGAADDIVF